MSLQHVDLQKIGASVATYLSLMCGPHMSSPHSPFYLSGEFPLSLHDFACRLTAYFACSPSCYAVACVYLRRVRIHHPSLFLDDRNAHKLLLAAITVATKFCEDRQCPQQHYAKCGGVDVEELNALESHFLALLGFSAFVSPAACARMERELTCPAVRLLPSSSF